MAAHCCDHDTPPGREATGWRRALWIALAVNLLMFLVELFAGSAADSHSLQADALDFLGDSANYAISLAVSGVALGWRARAAFVKGITIFLFGSFVAVSAVLAALSHTRPEAQVMGGVAILALIANVGVALLLFRFRGGDANMRSVWICSRNDAIGNLAVLAAAGAVAFTNSPWPDLAVAMIMASLAIWGGAEIMSRATAEIVGARDAAEQA
jgi:Co/Zn/Cd efflux system component